MYDLTEISDRSKKNPEISACFFLGLTEDASREVESEHAGEVMQEYTMYKSMFKDSKMYSGTRSENYNNNGAVFSRKGTSLATKNADAVS
jgi:hypothetical protein